MTGIPHPLHFADMRLRHNEATHREQVTHSRILCNQDPSRHTARSYSYWLPQPMRPSRRPPHLSQSASNLASRRNHTNKVLHPRIHDPVKTAKPPPLPLALAGIRCSSAPSRFTLQLSSRCSRSDPHQYAQVCITRLYFRFFPQKAPVALPFQAARISHARLPQSTNLLLLVLRVSDNKRL